MILSIDIISSIPYSGAEKMRELYGIESSERYISLDIIGVDEELKEAILNSVAVARHLGYEITEEQNGYVLNIEQKEALKLISLYLIYIAASKFSSLPPVLDVAVDSLINQKLKKRFIIDLYLSIRVLVVSLSSPFKRPPEWLYGGGMETYIDNSDIRGNNSRNYSSEILPFDRETANSFNRIGSVYIHLRNLNTSKIARLCVEGFELNNIKVSPSQNSTKVLDKSIKNALESDSKAVRINFLINSGVKPSDIIDVLKRTGVVKVMDQVTMGYISSLAKNEVKFDEWAVSDEGRVNKLIQTNKEPPKVFNLEFKKGN